ncbi:MAG: HU family DNA-binding protein [Succinatimonas hippei]|nr:HU family DNA-binding protein [Succinatimonas hippei]
MKKVKQESIVNKGQLVESVSKSANLSSKQAHDAVTAVFDAIKNSLAEGEDVTLIGFGTFLVRERAARTGRNPRTKETVKIPACKVPAFKAGAPLKAAVNGK